jgi:ABC-type molybdate transport system substrate-binding protein
MSVGKLIQKQFVNGWFVRLVYAQGRYLVNIFAPNGALHSQQFNSLANANSYFTFMCNQLRLYYSKKGKPGQLNLF